MGLLFQINFSLDTKMYKNHLTLQDIRTGDWVQEYSDITENFSMPMYVSAIFKDGTVYLDFNGNEGDIWEASIEDIAPVKIEPKVLNGFGFEYDQEAFEFKLQVDNVTIRVNKTIYNPNIWAVHFGEHVRYTQVCDNIHEMQHEYYYYTGKPLELTWKRV